MNKKFFFYGMIALLCASSFFLGCDSGNDDDSGTPTKSAEETLKDDLDGKAAVDGNVVTLTDNVNIAKAVTVPAVVTLKVPAGKTLTVAANGALTLTGTLTGEPADGGTAAAAFVLKAGGTVTGGSFYAANALLNAVVAGVYAWDANADGSDTADWNQTALDVTSAYSLKENGEVTTASASGVRVVSALKNTATNALTITLGGEFKANYVYTANSAADDVQGYAWNSGDWGPNGGNVPAAGKYGAVYIDGIFTETLSNVALKIQPYPALVFYSVNLHDSVLANPVPASEFPADSAIFLGATETDRQKWRLYGSFAAGPAGILLYDTGTNKTVTLDLDQYNGSASGSTKTDDLQTVTIDYHAVSFAAPVVQNVTASYSVKESESATSTAADFGVSVTSAQYSTATGLTITLGGTFGANYIYTGNNTASGSAGSSWVSGDWGPSGGNAPATGKYGAVYIDGIFTETLTNVALKIQPYPALVFYSVNINQTELQRPVTDTEFPNDSAIFLGATETDRQKWRLYDSFAAGPAGILLYSEGTNKTVRLDLDQYNGNTATAKKTGDIQAVTIDYSAVTFTLSP